MNSGEMDEGCWMDGAPVHIQVDVTFIHYWSCLALALATYSLPNLSPSLDLALSEVMTQLGTGSTSSLTATLGPADHPYPTQHLHILSHTLPSFHFPCAALPWSSFLHRSLCLLDFTRPVWPPLHPTQICCLWAPTSSPSQYLTHTIDPV